MICESSEINCRKFLETTIIKKWYPVMRLKLYQSSKIKLPLSKEKYEYLRKLMLRHFLHSCYNIPARKEKDLTSKMGLNLAKNLRQKKRDGLLLWSKDAEKPTLSVLLIILPNR